MEAYCMDEMITVMTSFLGHICPPPMYSFYVAQTWQPLQLSKKTRVIQKKRERERKERTGTRPTQE